MPTRLLEEERTKLIELRKLINQRIQQIDEQIMEATFLEKPEYIEILIDRPITSPRLWKTLDYYGYTPQRIEELRSEGKVMIKIMKYTPKEIGPGWGNE